MSALTTITNVQTHAMDALVPGWRDWLRDLLWHALDEMEQMDGEQSIYTFRHHVGLWGLRVPVSFTFRVKHLRYVVAHLIGDRR